MLSVQLVLDVLLLLVKNISIVKTVLVVQDMHSKDIRIVLVLLLMVRDAMSTIVRILVGIVNVHIQNLVEQVVVDVKREVEAVLYVDVKHGVVDILTGMMDLILLDGLVKLITRDVRFIIKKKRGILPLKKVCSIVFSYFIVY